MALIFNQRYFLLEEGREMADFTVNIKAIMDINDVKHNVDQIQQKFNNLNISPKLKDTLNKDLNNFYKEYSKYTSKIEGGIKTQNQYNSAMKSLESMDKLYQKIGKDAERIAGIKPLELFKDTPELANFANNLAKMKAELANLKIDDSKITGPLNKIKELTTNTKAKGLVDALLGANAKGDFETVLAKAKELEVYTKRATAVMHDTTKAGQMSDAMRAVTNAIADTTKGAGDLQKKIADTESQMNRTANSLSNGAKKAADGFRNSGKEVNKLTEDLKRIKTEEFGANQQIQMLDRQILRYFTLGQMIRKVGDIAKQAWSTVKELDASMTQTAVVTNFSVSDMWDKLPMYTDTANQLGSTIKDVYDATTLYYQQGLNTNQAMGVATETLKMARIGGLQAAEATDMMTAALRGFNMQVNEMSAQRINDVYSKLAAITASNTQELGSAMTRTASIANSAGMQFETTSAFLAQMIETTREAPENLGTAMKTIVARFQEMKKAPEDLVDSEGELLDANRVEKALKTIGVALRDTNGDFRDLDQVFLEISAKWNTLSMGQQRYIATMAAGSRQQSRFIAMMGNHERVMELVNAANNSAGASEAQFNKTLDSMEAKLNQFHNAWNEFAMSMMNSSFAKGIVDAGTTILGVINKIVSVAGKIAPDPFKGITKSLVALTAVTSTFKLGKGLFGLIRTPLAKFGASAIGLKDSDPYGITDMLTEIGKDAKDKGIKIGKDLKEGIRSSLQGGNGLLQREFSFDQMLGLKNIDLSKYANEVNTQLNEALNKHFFNSDTGDETAARGLISKITTDLRNNRGDLAKEDFNTLVKDYGISPETLKTLKLTDEDFKKITDSAQRAGDGIYRFGVALQGTPLAPFGQLLMKAGTFMNMFDQSAKKAAKSVLEFSKARLQALKTNGQEGNSDDFQMSSTAKAGVAIAIITALVAAWIAGVQKMKEQERELQTVAAGASEAFSSARQETSELKDKLDQLETSESAFDGLVAGSAEFEEKLADVNNKIDELIKMYPQLESLGYVKIDNNGLKSITQEGKDYILEYQKEIENTAGALNTLATGELNAQKKRKEADKVKMPAKTTERSYDKLHAFSQETDESKEARKPYLQEQKDIKAEAETIRKTSQANAIKSTLTQEHLSNVENLTSIMAERYEDISKQTEESLGNFSTHKKDYYEAYADALGYSYEGGKLFNAQHEEVEVDEKTVEQGAIRALTISQIEVDAKALDSAFYEINNAAKKQLKISGEGSDTFISDIMGRNTEVNQKALEQSLKNDGKALKDFVDEMSDEEVALQVGVDLETFKQDAKGYRKQLKDTLVQAASDTQDAVSKQYGDLGVMMLRAQGQTLVGATAGVDEGRGELTQVIQAKISELTAAQRSFATTVGQGLQENLGVDSMSTFMNQYIDANNKVKKEISSNLTDVDFSSSIETLGAFTKMSKSTTKEVQTLGKDLLNSADSAHLLGSAMEEVQTSESWAEVAKNMDKYVNSAGELDAAGVEQMAAECGPLNDLLNTGAINASGFAMALDALEGSGVDSLSQINTSVLQLLSSFASLDGVMANAHNTVANFNAGVDTGEVEDFMQENVDKIKEFINNGEWGNDELQTRIKSIVGVDAWNKALKDSGGNLEKAIKSFNIGKNFKEGFDTAWDNISSGKGIKNGQLVNVDEIKGLNKEIQGGWKYLSDGSKQWQLDIGNATTEQVVEWLQKVYEVNESTAEMMLTDFENYSSDLKTKLQANDVTATMRNGEFYENNTLEGTNTSVLSKSNLQLLANQMSIPYKDLQKEFEKYAGENNKTFRVFNNQNKKGELSTNWDVLNKRLSALAEGTKTKNQQDIYAWLKPFTQGKTIDVDKSMAQATQAGATDEQVQNMLYRAFRDLTSQGQEFEYNGETLDASEISTFDDFINKLSTIDQNAEWTQVGEAIASGYLDYIKSQDQPEQKRVNDFSGIGINSGEQERINEAQVELDVAFNNPDVTQGAEQLAQIKEQLDLSGQAAGALNEQFVALNAASLSQLSDTELLKVWESLGYGETEIDNIRAKLEGHPFVFETKLKGKSLEDHINKISLLTGKQREILLSTEISGTEKVDQFLEELYKTFGADTEVKKKAIIEATTKFATGDKEGGQQILKDAGFGEKDIPVIEQQLQVLYDGSIANPEQLKKGLNKQIDKVVDDTEGTKKKIKKEVEVIGTSTVINKQKGKKQKKEKAWNVTNTISTVVNGASDVLQLTGIIKKVPLKTAPKVVASVSGEGALTSLKNKLDSLPLVKTVKTIFKKVTTKGNSGEDGDWRGQGNTGAIPALPAGSLAKGTKKLGIGQIGPNGQGGPTLTGELGYEIAWLPNEGKSMIVGANGPQMIDLPKNAVVWNHEQSKKILKQKSIPIGSQANPTTGKKRGGNRSNGNNGSNGSNGRGGGGGSGSGNGSNNKAAKLAKGFQKIVEKGGKLSVWWENQTRKVDAVIRKADQLQKKIDKLLSKSTVTMNSISGNVSAYIKKLNQSISLNQQSRKKANSALKSTDKNGKATISWDYQQTTFSKKQRKTKKFKNANNEYKAAQNAVKQAKKTKSIKDDKKAQARLKRADKKLRKAGTTKKKTKKGKVNIGKYIDYDAATDSYVINQKKLDQVSKKNKSKGKAIKEAATKKIENYTQKKNTAEDNIQKAQDQLDEIGKKLYDTFYGWKNELTKILDITNKIANTESKISRIKGLQELNNAQLESGLQQLTGDFINQSIELFKSQVAGMRNIVLQRRNAINLQKEELNKALGVTDENKQVTDLKQQKTAIQNANKAKKVKNKADAQVQKDEKAISKANAAKRKKKKAQTKKAKAVEKIDKAKEILADKKASKEDKKKAKKQLAKAQKDKKAANKTIKTSNKAIKAGKKAKNRLKSDKTSASKAKTTFSNAQKELTDVGLSKSQWTDADIAANKAQLEAAKERKAQVKAAQRYISYTRNADGTVNLSIDSDQLEADKQAGKISENMYNAIKAYYDEAKEANDNLASLYEEQLNTLTEMYSLLSELRDQYADYADELMEAMEAAEQENIDKLTKLNDSLTNHLKKLLDEVKRRLEQRRQAEDNAKTENDIAKKQQRLATLRADTSGGHASEIKQLEQEIAEAQQNYGRTLEDQTLQRLEQQADDAAEQRQHQIDLLQAQLELQQVSGENVGKINDLLLRLQSNDESVRGPALLEAEQLLREKNEYDKQNFARQQVIDTTITTALNGLTTLPAQIDSLISEIGIVKTEADKTEADIAKAAQEMTTAEEGSKSLQKFLVEQKANGVNANTALAAARQINPDADYTDLRAAGWTAKDFKKQNVSASDALTAFSGSELKKNGYTATDFKKGNVDYATAKQTFGDINTLAKVGYEQAKNAISDEYDNFIFNRGDSKSKSKHKGKIGAADFKEQLSRGKLLGKTVKDVAVDLAKTKELTWKEVLKAVSDSKVVGPKAIKQWFPKASKTSAFRKAFNTVFTKGWSKYASGGMNYTTGPAWLDGTRAKPEAVLNATETKNFIALKDILSDVMGHITDNNTTTYGDSTYEININVDHLNNDYDVDKVAKRVEKIITEDASYRNVTMVRKFR